MMKLNFKLSTLAVAAALASGAAMAANPINVTTGNSSLAFVAMDNTGTPASLFVDLGFLFSEWKPGEALVGPNQNVQWNFNTNAVTVNGVAKPGTYNYSSQFAIFAGGSEVANTTYGVVAGSTGGFPDLFLSTGLPTATELAAQTIQGSNTDNMAGINSLFFNQNFEGSFGTSNAAFGANAVIGTGPAAVGLIGNFGSGGNWRGQLAWNATVAEGTANKLYYLENENYTATPFDGQFNYAGGVLTWQSAVTAVPEPSAFMMTMAGLAVLGFSARRRRQER